MSRSPTFDDTYNDLIAVCKAAQKGLYDLGRCREAYADEELTTLVLGVSKDILGRLPCLQLQNDAIEHEDSRYSTILTTLENCEGDEVDLQCQDQADCHECIEPCDFREGEE
jgi:hypothetical protein